MTRKHLSVVSTITILSSMFDPQLLESADAEPRANQLLCIFFSPLPPSGNKRTKSNNWIFF